MERRLVAMFISGALLFLGGVYVGYTNQPAVNWISSVTNKEPAELGGESVDFEPFWRAWRIIEEKYVSIDTLDRQTMVWGAISGLAASLGDPYTVFFPPEEKKIFDSEVRGDFEGVGMEIGMRKGILVVVAPLKGTPAYNAGVKAGDKILKIGDESTAEMTVDEAVRKIRGKKGTTVTLTLLRNGEDDVRVIEIARDVIQIPIYEAEKKGSVFVIRLFSFSERSPAIFRQALKEFIESGSSKLVLDLRNNPGGYLEAAVDVASWFLPAGDIVAREDFGHGKEELHRSRGYDVFENLALVVLVNGGSASASEIVAGALRDHDVAKIVGTKTFGKGSVQELLSVTSDTSLKVTIARWLTPNGHSISESGLEPDVVQEAAGENDEAIDPQLDKAIELLKELPQKSES